MINRRQVRSARGVGRVGARPQTLCPRSRLQTTVSSGGSHGEFVRVTMPIHAFFGRQLRVIRHIREGRTRHFIDVEHPLAPLLGLRLPVQWTDRATPDALPARPEGWPRLSPEVALDFVGLIGLLTTQSTVGRSGSRTGRRQPGGCVGRLPKKRQHPDRGTPGASTQGTGHRAPPKRHGAAVGHARDQGRVERGQGRRGGR